MEATRGEPVGNLSEKEVKIWKPVISYMRHEAESYNKQTTVQALNVHLMISNLETCIRDFARLGQVSHGMQILTTDNNRYMIKLNYCKLKTKELLVRLIIKNLLNPHYIAKATKELWPCKINLQECMGAKTEVDAQKGVHIEWTGPELLLWAMNQIHYEPLSNLYTLLLKDMSQKQYVFNTKKFAKYASASREDRHFNLFYLVFWLSMVCDKISLLRHLHLPLKNFIQSM
ncbi:hypothetical protein IPH67_02455 [bacterium]|nr:MAG: hypothetical protein IPH67_02455 [bacterium]